MSTPANGVVLLAQVVAIAGRNVIGTGTLLLLVLPMLLTPAGPGMLKGLKSAFSFPDYPKVRASALAETSHAALQAQAMCESSCWTTWLKYVVIVAVCA